jgi:transposase-like protein
MIHAKFGLFSTRCPHCRSIDFRSGNTRNAIETAFQWLLQPYWCSLCGHRFFLFRWQIPVGGTV